MYILLDTKDLVLKLASSSIWSLGQNLFSLPIIFSLSYFFSLSRLSLEDKLLSLSYLVDNALFPLCVYLFFLKKLFIYFGHAGS